MSAACTPDVSSRSRIGAPGLERIGGVSAGNQEAFLLKHALKLVSLLLVIVVGIGAGDVALDIAVGVRLSAQTAAPDACSLLSVEELEKALGRPFGRSRQRQEQSGTSCRFTAGAGGSITVSVATTSKAGFDQFRKLLTDEGKRPEAVSGVGDDAYYWDARIYVRVGARSMTIWNGEPKQAGDKLRGEVLTLAKLLAPKLR